MPRTLASLVALAALVCMRAPAAADARFPAHAGPLDADAALIARIDLDHLERVLRAAREASSPLAAGARAVRALSRSQAGFDPLTGAGWRDAGFATDEPILVSALALDRRAADAAIGGAAPADVVFWRNRALIPIADRRAAEETIRRVARAIPGLAVPGEGAAPVESFGADPDALAAANVLAGGRVGPVGALVLARRRERHIAVDVLVPLAGDPAPARAWRAASRPGTGLPLAAAGALASPGVGLWTAPARVHFAFDSAHRRRLAEAVASTLALETPVPIPPDPACRDFQKLAESGALTDIGVVVRAGEGGVRARVSWSIRPGSGLADHLDVGPHAILPPARAEVALAWSLARPAQLRALRRPGAFDRALRDLRRHARECGPGAEIGLWLFGWPEVTGAFFGQVADLGPRAAALADAVGPGAAAARALEFDLDRLVAAVEIARAPRATVSARGPDVVEVVDDLLDQVFGFSRPGPEHVDRVWGRGRLSPYRRSIERGETSFGLGLGARSLTWFLGDEVARAAPRPDAWAWLRLDGGRAVEILADEVDVIATWLDRGGASIGPIEARASAEPERVRLDVAIELRR